MYWTSQENQGTINCSSIFPSSNIWYCKLGNCREGFIVADFRENAKFVKIKSSQNAEITLSFSDIGKSCPSPDILPSQICILKLY